MAFAGQKRFLLESKPFANGGNVQVSLKDIPPGRRIRNLFLRLELAIAQPGAATAITGKTILRFFKSIRIGRRIFGSGTFFSVLDWAVHGMRPELPADVPNTISTTFNRNVDIIIPFADDHAMFPEDPSPASEWYKDTPIVIDFDSAATLAPTNTPTVTGTLRSWAEHEPLDPYVLPSLIEMMYLDWNGQRVVLDGDRVYTHLFTFNEDGSVIDSSQITGLTLSLDGEQYDNVPMRAQDIAMQFDWRNGQGTSTEALSATAPVAGENITDVQPFAGGGGNVSMEWCPLVTHGINYKLTKCEHATRQAALDFQGSKTSFRMGWRAIVPRTDAERVQLATLRGIATANTSNWRIKTGSKNMAANARLAAILPLRFGKPGKAA
jgi:hypothetical protein